MEPNPKCRYMGFVCLGVDSTKGTPGHEGQTLGEPEGNLAGISWRHEMALELVCRADFGCNWYCKTSPIVLEGGGAENRPENFRPDCLQEFSKCAQSVNPSAAARRHVGTTHGRQSLCLVAVKTLGSMIISVIFLFCFGQVLAKVGHEIL
jgi:hypothetical protein